MSKKESTGKIVSVFEVEVWDIEVGRSDFGFEFSVKENGEEVMRDYFSDDHVWAGDREGFMDHLQDGFAVRLAIESVT